MEAVTAQREPERREIQYVSRDPAPQRALRASAHEDPDPGCDLPNAEQP
jgi:hypothetical protein